MKKILTILAAMVFTASASAGVLPLKQLISTVVANDSLTGNDREVAVFDGFTNRITGTDVTIDGSGNMTVGGSVILDEALVEKGYADVSTTPYTAVVGTSWIFVNTSGGNREVDLPACGTTNDGVTFHIREVDSTNNTTVDPNSTELIDGSATSFSFDAEAVNGINIRCKGAGSNQGWWSY